MRILKKTVKNRLSVGGPAPNPVCLQRLGRLRPQTPTLLLPPTITALLSSFLALNAFYFPHKKNKITTVNVLFLLHPHFCTYFYFKLCSFCRKDRKNTS